MKSHRTEKGQVLVLIVLSAVALFGFAALAVDVGRVYAERRRAQNAADASALAAAFAWQNASLNKTTITDGQAETIALKKAELNGFYPVAGDKRVEVVYHHPPIDGPYVDDEEYFQVFVTTTVDQAFSQILFTGSSRITVVAVARSRPTRSITPGDAMFATNKKDCSAIQFSGSGSTSITGGNVFSNSGANANNCAALERNGSGNINVAPPHGIYASGKYVDNGNGGGASPAPAGNQGPKEIPDVPLPDCSNLPARTFNSGSATLQPGRYAGGINIQNGSYTMAPGMYCLYDTFHVNGGSLFGKSVMIVQWNGDVDFNGNATINMTRANDLIDGSRQHWGGMLFFMPPDNHGGIDLAGGAGSTYTGTIYAPGPRDSNKPKCTVMGNGNSIGLSSNIICNTIEVGGSGGVVINYKEEQNFRLPPIVDLSQ